MSLGGLFGGGGGAPRLTVPAANRAHTPGFSLRSSFDATTGKSDTYLTRLGSPAQSAFSDRFPRILGDIDTVRGTIAPGFSLIRKARADAVENARRRSLGNLRDNLTRRRIAGSSFAGDALARAEAEFAQAGAQQQAQAFLDEFNANVQVLNQESATIADALNRELQELGIASGMAQNFLSQFLQQDRAQAALTAQAQANEGALGGSLLGLGLSALVSPISGGSLLGAGLGSLGFPVIGGATGGAATSSPRFFAGGGLPGIFGQAGTPIVAN